MFQPCLIVLLSHWPKVKKKKKKALENRILALLAPIEQDQVCFSSQCKMVLFWISFAFNIQQFMQREAPKAKVN